jgi:hypothetical protein
MTKGFSAEKVEAYCMTFQTTFANASEAARSTIGQKEWLTIIPELIKKIKPKDKDRHVYNHNLHTLMERWWTDEKLKHLPTGSSLNSFTFSTQVLQLAMTHQRAYATVKDLFGIISEPTTAGDVPSGGSGKAFTPTKTKPAAKSSTGAPQATGKRKTPESSTPRSESRSSSRGFCNTCGHYHKLDNPCLKSDNPDANLSSLPWQDSDKGKQWYKYGYDFLQSKVTLAGLARGDDPIGRWGVYGGADDGEDAKSVASDSSQKSNKSNKSNKSTKSNKSSASKKGKGPNKKKSEYTLCAIYPFFDEEPNSIVDCLISLRVDLPPIRIEALIDSGARKGNYMSQQLANFLRSYGLQFHACSHEVCSANDICTPCIASVQFDVILQNRYPTIALSQLQATVIPMNFDFIVGLPTIRPYDLTRRFRELFFEEGDAPFPLNSLTVPLHPSYRLSRLLTASLVKSKGKRMTDLQSGKLRTSKIFRDKWRRPIGDFEKILFVP